MQKRGKPTSSATSTSRGDDRGQKPSIQRIRLIEAKNEDMIKLLLGGKIDLINKITWNRAIMRGRQYAGQKRMQVQDYDRRGLAFLAFTCDGGVTQSLTLRRALASVVSRQRIVEDALWANGKPVYGYYGLGQDMVRGQEKEIGKLLNIYPYHFATAEKLLVEDGWLYNEQGKEVKTARSKQRYRMLDNGQLEPLVLTLAIVKDNPIADVVAKHLSDNIKRVGGKLEVTRLDATELFRQYYRQDARAYDMLFLGSNFDMVFDPYQSFLPLDEGPVQTNQTGIESPFLVDSSDDLRQTRPGDTITYGMKWQRFQQLFVNELPLLPLYSNTYYDAFSNDLTGYRPQDYFSWAQAILYAKWK